MKRDSRNEVIYRGVIAATVDWIDSDRTADLDALTNKRMREFLWLLSK